MVKKQQKLFAKFAEQQCSKLVESKNNFENVFKTFRRDYQLVPLEVFSKDPYKTLISTLLSSRTKDEVTLKACKRLFKVAPDLKSLSQISQPNIQKNIYPVGFYKTKSKYLIELAKVIDKVPNTREELMKLPGVGRKTANLVLNRAFGIPAIAVDTHVHRISNMLGWVNSRTPEQTEKQLINFLPKKYWPDTNRLFVSIGRQYRSIKKLSEYLKQNNLI